MNEENKNRTRKKAAAQIALGALVIILAVMTCRLDFSEIQNGNWLLLLGLLLTLTFIKELRKAWRGEEIAWNTLTSRDKLIFFVCTTALFIISLFPVMENMPFGMIISSVLIGLFLVWVISDRFGSDALKDHLWFR